MEEEIKKAAKLGKKKLLEMAPKLGLSDVNGKMTLKDIAPMIAEEIDDLNTWLEAKANVPKDMSVMRKEGLKGIYKGKCVKTGEKLYS